MRRLFHMVEWRNAQGFPTGQWVVFSRSGKAVGGPFSLAQAQAYIEQLERGVLPDDDPAGDGTDSPSPSL